MIDLISGPLVVALGAVIAALIAGAFSYFNLISSKESKVSEFRQEWINALRQEISVYVSRTLTHARLGSYIASFPDTSDSSRVDLMREYSRLQEEALTSYHSIHLRINSTEIDELAKKLNDDLLNALNTAAHIHADGPSVELEKSLQTLIRKAEPLLKHEWRRVKSGEPAYRSAKFIAVLVMCVALVIGLAGIGVIALNTIKFRVGLESSTATPPAVPFRKLQ